MDKVILINKEKGSTSRDVVNSLTKILNERKIGHFGTLDPIAEGLLVVGVGVLTKIGNFLENEDKEYIAEVLIGTSTTTYDITGDITEKSNKQVSKEKLIETLNTFIGTYNQEVPIYSAVKVKGKKLYEYARNNEIVTLPKKEVEIKNIELLNYYEKNNQTYFTFKCLVSKGTYIRSLINDISKKLDIPMCMNNLKRTKCGNFKLEDSFTLESIKKGKYKSLNIEDILNLDIMELPKNIEKLVLNGSMIDKIGNKMILFKKNNQNIALYGMYKDRMKPLLTFKK